MEIGTINILFFGDVIGRPGRNALKKHLPHLKEKYQAKYVIANGENGSGGIGLTPDSANEIFDAGVDVITSGNHIWQHKEIFEYINQNERLIRPINFPQSAPGRGYVILEDKLAIINVIGRVFMPPVDCPFIACSQLIEEIKDKTELMVVDFHAEATAEKQSLAWYLDGKVSAVIGTHTHIQTADERILPGGTGYITDVGMVGPLHSIIGIKIEPVITRFLTGIPQRYDVATGKVIINAIFLSLNPKTGKAEKIERINLLEGEIS